MASLKHPYSHQMMMWDRVVPTSVFIHFIDFGIKHNYSVLLKLSKIHNLVKMAHHFHSPYLLRRSVAFGLLPVKSQFLMDECALLHCWLLTTDLDLAIWQLWCGNWPPPPLVSKQWETHMISYQCKGEEQHDSVHISLVICCWSCQTKIVDCKTDHNKTLFRPEMDLSCVS